MTASERGAGANEAGHSAWVALVGIAVPNVLTILNMQVVRAALPYIRADLNGEPQVLAWIVTIYTLLHVLSMPISGWLGDQLGKRRMLLVATMVLLLGTGVNLFARSLPWLLLGRGIQGIGAGSAVPLAIAMVSELFSGHERGRALGTWNGVGVAAGVVATLAGGALVDTLGWHMVFAFVLVAGVAGLVALWRMTPAEAVTRRRIPPRLFVSTLDWGGVGLLSGAMTSLLCYTSSEAVTGAPSLHDWRLLATAAVLLSSFIAWERRGPNPFVDLSALSHRSYACTAASAAVRMFVMNGIAFLIPLYLLDVCGLGAAASSLVLVSFDLSLFVAMEVGGQLVDRWGSRLPLVLGLTLQVTTTACIAVLKGGSGVGPLAMGLALNGLGAGVAQPALHHAAMAGAPLARTGSTAGLYSMIRYSGGLVGTAVVAVVLQQALATSVLRAEAYRIAFGFTAIVGALGPIIGLASRGTRQTVLTRGE